MDLDENLLHAVRQYSDWRLYRGALDDAVGLPVYREPPQQTKGTAHEVEFAPIRNWKSYADLHSTEQSFVSALLAQCTEMGDRKGTRGYVAVVGDRKTPFHARFRVQNLDGLYACRLLSNEPPDLTKLRGYSSQVISTLLSPAFRQSGGLVLHIGSAGVGKTTGAAATVRARLLQLGGYCLTLQDPVELFIADVGTRKVGKAGYVDEIDVSDIGYREALPHALRAFPTGRPGVLFFGEIRADSDAAQLLHISCDGHEVHSTVHAMNPDAMVSRLVGLAMQGRGGEESHARALLAQSLKLVVHHQVIQGITTVTATVVNERIARRIKDGDPLPFSAEMQTMSASERRGDGQAAASRSGGTWLRK